MQEGGAVRELDQLGKCVGPLRTSEEGSAACERSRLYRRGGNATK
jgi:hypothetical protein